MAHIEIKNLSFKYKTSEKNSLSDVSFTINKGDFVVLCGKSGCGKTTLLKCLKPNIMPAGKTEGEILLESRNIESLTDREQAKKIGFVMQNPEYQIVTDKVWHELAFGLESMGEKNEIIRSKEKKNKEKKKIERWQKISESAAKQCGRGIIPEVGQVMSFKEAVEEASKMDGAVIPYKIKKKN